MSIGFMRLPREAIPIPMCPIVTIQSPEWCCIVSLTPNE